MQAAARAYFDKDVSELTLPEAAYLAVLPKAPANYDPVRATQKALDRRNYVLREMFAQRLHHRGPVARAAATPLGTIRYGSSEKFRQQGGYFMEEVRRELIQQVRRERRGRPEQPLRGRPVGAQLDGPKMQDAAAQALRDGLVRLRRWARLERPGLSIDTSGLGGGARPRAGRDRLSTTGEGGRPVEGGGEATIGFTNGATGTLPASGASMPVRGAGGSAFDALKPGMVIIVKQTVAGSYDCASVPVFRAACSPKKSIPAACWPCRAASTSSARATTVRPRRFASRAPRSSRSSM